MTETKNVEKVYAVVQAGRAASRVGHKFADCSTVRGETLDGLSQREAGLLGLRECSVCTKRASGGPAFDALEGFFGEDFPVDLGDPKQAAWNLLEYLKERGMYVAVRGVKKGAADAD